MLAALSCASATALWIVTDPAATRVLASASWTGNESAGISRDIGRYFSQVLNEAKIEASQLTKVFGVSGPGAFTGLRVSGAYLQGLARALGIPLQGISSFEIFNQAFYVPLQHQKAKHWTRAEALARAAGGEEDFLLVESAQDFRLARPDARALLVGTSERAEWPTAEELRASMARVLSRAPEDFRLRYGLGPKVFGKRYS